MGALWTTMAAALVTASPMGPTALRCEYRVNPLGTDVAQPRLSWILESKRRGERQTAYQILVAGSEADLKADRGDLWDSGRVASDRSAQVAYEGAALHSGQRAWWKVRVWDKDGGASGYSAPAFWEMGLLQPDDWKAQWIGLPDAAQVTGPDAKNRSGPAACLRRTFRAAKPIQSARLYASAKGLYKLYVNGQRVGNDIFTPGWTDYRKRIQYQTYDVTKQLKTGENALGVLLGDGWYCGFVAWAGRQNYGPFPRALVQLHITYADGTDETVVSDDSWKAATGPILASDLLMGETYDARKEMPGWAAPGFDDSKWAAVETEPVLSALPIFVNLFHVVHMFETPLVAQYGPTVQQTDELRPKSVTAFPTPSAQHPTPDGYVFDMGQNMVGWARLKVKGPAGTTVRLRFAEMLNPDGSVYTTNLRKAKATDTYTLRGNGAEVYEPSFTFHGFRYVEVTGYPGRPGPDAITGIVVSSVHRPGGTFECSNPMVNQLQHNIVWGQKGNYLEVPTDCPQRDERLGWMGDAQIFARTACYNQDVAAFLTKWTQDVVDAQSPEGGFADVSPRIAGLGNAAPAWGDAGVIVPWTVYLFYDDTRLLAERYDAMAKWIEYIHSANPDLLWVHRSGNNYGDWLNIRADMPREILATAYFAYSTRLLAKIARVLGKNDEAQKYEDLFQQIKAAFNAAFVQPDGRIVNREGRGDTQTCYVLALRFDLLPEDRRPLAAQRLVTDILEKRSGHLSTGFVGVGYLTPTLTDTDHADVAYRLLLNDTFPSWGYSIKHGATTIWERWDGWTAEKGFQDPGMNSFNHYSLGSVGEWMFSAVAGIGLDPAQPGFRHIILHPRPGGGLTYARADYDSLHGRIVSDWKREGGKFHYGITVPANTTATVYVPAKNEGAVTESGKPASQAEGVRYLRREEGCAVFEVGSGNYAFASE
jgi:alpha-L-rhamnosidase